MDHDKEIGVADCVLLHEISETALVKNIQDRFAHEKIYTFIGKTVISVNPYKALPIYEKDYIELYRGANTFERPPHVYSLAETAFTNMRDKNIDQCVIISGESGAGKTETSKVLMRYISAVSGSSQRVDKIKDQLLNSNPCLEAFGNAKTLRNDNSSRFGKYMDLEFDYKGMPCGGRVTTYLLEKSRVTSRLEGERAFHIFYQILRGPDSKLLAQLELSNDPSHYAYLRQSNCDVIPGIDDKSHFGEVCTAMDKIGISKEDRFALFEGVAGVLHLGNLQFEVKQSQDPAVSEAAGDSVRSQVVNKEVLAKAANRLGVTPGDLEYSLTHRLIRDNAAGGSKHFEVPLTPEQAQGARDSFARSLYGRLFEWLVGRLNERIASVTEHSATIKLTAKKNVIGVVDIYGFEVFHRNGMDQLLINYCNEKLQQLFIELTLKSEQDEYASEGIPWTHIDYFNNKTILDLLENKKTGIISVLDEECVRPGETSDTTFLSKLDASNMKHAHYDSYAKSRSDKVLQASKGAFRLKHYAGDVTYEVEGFLEKNKDALNKDLIRAMGNSSKMTVQELFPESSSAAQDLRRPDTLAVQFKNSMQKLTENLASKQPHYVRCIKPNLEKKSSLVDVDLLTHQVRYLGLLENVRIRRAGYCYRQKFGDFVRRYKMLSKETWPQWNGEDKKGVSTILVQNGVPDDGKEFVFGATKVFIKNPLTLFKLETKRSEVKHELATSLQATFRGHRQRQIYLKTRAAAIKIESTMRMRIQYLKYQKVLKTVASVARVWRGHKARKEYKQLRRKLPKYACTVIQRSYRRYRARVYLTQCAKAARTASGHWMKIQWPAPGKLRSLKAVEPVLLQMYRKVMARKYRMGLSEDRKAMMEWKLVGSTFLSRKASYKESIQKSFTADHIGLSDPGRSKKLEGTLKNGEPVLSAVPVIKLNRSNLQWDAAGRVLVLTDSTVYMFRDDDAMTLKERVSLANVQGCSVSTFKDGMLVIHCSSEQEKGDVIVCSDAYCIEFVSRLYLALKAKGKVLKIDVAESCNYSVHGKSTKMTFSSTNDHKITRPSVKKAKGAVSVLVPE